MMLGMNVLSPQNEQHSLQAAAPDDGKSPLAEDASRGKAALQRQTGHNWELWRSLKHLPGLSPKAGKVPLTNTPRAEPCRAVTVCIIPVSSHSCHWIKSGQLRDWRKTGSNRAQCGIFALKAELYGLTSPLHLRQADI